MAALSAFAAFAQSTVTLSGQIDVGVTNPIGPQKLRVDQSANGANQIVFSGSEDLGSGLRATFRLAQRFSPESGLNDGSAGNRPLFQGESTIGLAGSFGSVRIGRALTAFQGPINNTDPWGTLQQGSLAVLTTGYATAPDNVELALAPGGTVAAAATGGGLARTDGIFYTSPNMGGFTASLTYGPKNTQVSGATTTGANALTSAWLQYAAGPLLLALGGEENRAGDRIMAVQAAYDLGMAKLGATYAVLDPDASPTDRESYNLSVVAPFGAFILKAGIGRSKLEDAPASVKKAAIGLDYVLSKRTLVYTSFGRDAALGSDKTGFDIGVRHTF